MAQANAVLDERTTRTGVSRCRLTVRCNRIHRLRYNIFFSDTFEQDTKGVKNIELEAKVLLGKLKTRLEVLPEWNHDNIESAICGLDVITRK